MDRRGSPSSLPTSTVEAVRGDIGGEVAEVGIADHGHQREGVVPRAGVLVLDLDSDIGDVRANGGVVIAPGVFPRDVQDL